MTGDISNIARRIVTIWVVLVALATFFGCATRVPLEQPLCVATPECDLKWAAWNKQEDRAALKHTWEALKQCPDGYVFVCDARWCQGTFTPSKMPKRNADWIGSGCTTADTVRKAYKL